MNKKHNWTVEEEVICSALKIYFIKSFSFLYKEAL